MREEGRGNAQTGRRHRERELEGTRPSARSVRQCGRGQYIDAMQDEEDERVDDGRGCSDALRDIPFELVSQVAGAGAVAEAGDVERSATARHGDGRDGVP